MAVPDYRAGQDPLACPALLRRLDGGGALVVDGRLVEGIEARDAAAFAITRDTHVSG
jgi:hypothetical protein